MLVTARFLGEYKKKRFHGKKIDQKSKGIKIEGDATVIMPIKARALFERHGKSKQQSRRLSHAFE